MLYEAFLKLMIGFSAWYLLGLFFINTTVQGVFGALVAGVLPIAVIVVVLWVFKGKNSERSEIHIGYCECFAISVFVPISLYFSYIFFPFFRNSISGYSEYLYLMPKFSLVTIVLVLIFKALLHIFRKKTSSFEKGSLAFNTKKQWFIYAALGLLVAVVMLRSVHSYNCLMSSSIYTLQAHSNE